MNLDRSIPYWGSPMYLPGWSRIRTSCTAEPLWSQLYIMGPPNLSQFKREELLSGQGISTICTVEDQLDLLDHVEQVEEFTALVAPLVRRNPRSIALMPPCFGRSFLKTPVLLLLSLPRDQSDYVRTNHVPITPSSCSSVRRRTAIGPTGSVRSASGQQSELGGR